MGVPAATSTIAVLLIIVVAIAGCSAPSTQGTMDDENRAALIAQYPAPGRLVDVDGSRMHIWCTGTGTPTVILEAGSTDCSLSWAYVQANVSRFTRVCSYDRAGYGWSDPDTGPVSARSVNERLHTLLINANISPPYVLVGHSLGGEYVRAYAHTYPDDVAGLVLVDPGSEWHMTRVGEPFATEQRTAVASAAAAIRAGKEGAINGTYSRNLSLVAVDPRLPGYEYRAYQALLATRPAFWEARAVEAESAFTIFEEIQRDNISSTRVRFPISVISSDNPMGFASDPVTNEHVNTVFRALQQEMARESSNGTYRVAPGTGHYVQLDRPDIVTETVRSVVDVAR